MIFKFKEIHTENIYCFHKSYKNDLQISWNSFPRREFKFQNLSLYAHTSLNLKF